MINNKFHIVLHGHQHDLVVRKYVEAHGKELFQSDEGFLSIGAPEMDILGTKTPSYNVISIEIPEVGKVAKLNVVKYSYHKSTGEVETREAETDIVFGFPTDAERQLTRKTKRVIFEGKASDSIRRALDDPQDRAHHTESFRRSLCGDSLPLGMYALSVFGAQRWFGNKIMEFQMPYATDNLLRSAFDHPLKKAGESWRIVHHISASVAKAIDTATKNGKVLDNLRRALNTRGTGVAEYDDLIRRCYTDGAPSLSVFGHSNVTNWPDGHQVKLVIENTGADMAEGGVLKPAGLRRIRESVRILFWDKEDLRLPSAFDIIMMHEALQIPLFWLDPMLIMGNDSLPREKVGYFMYFTGEATAEPEFRMHQWMFEKGGVQASLEDGITKAWRGIPPKSLKLPKRASLWDEYRSFLKHDGLLFAIDAWSIVQSV